MSSILDAAFLLGVESTYGTPVTATRAYEAKADAWKRVTEPLESVGMRAGMHTGRSDRRKQIVQGAEGELGDIDWMTSGMGLVLQSMLGTVSGPASDVTTLTTDSGSDPASFTVQLQRVTDDGSIVAFTYPGAVVTSWTITQAVGDMLKLGLTFDAQTEVTDEASGTPTYPSGAVPFCWPDCEVSIAGSPVDNVSEISFEGDLGLKTDRRFLRASALKKAPRRSSVPSYAGSLTADFSTTDEYDRYVAGSIFEVEATWTGESFGGGNYGVTVTAPACQYDGDTPVSSLSELTMQTMPFKILHNGTDPAITITVTSDDVAL